MDLCFGALCGLTVWDLGGEFVGVSVLGFDFWVLTVGVFMIFDLFCLCGV